MEVHNIGNILEATKLKRGMMRRFLCITASFFAVSIAFQGIIPIMLEYFTKTLYFTTTLDLIQQIVDILIFGWLLYNFRARNWPNYFLIASFDLSNLAHFLIGDDKTVNITEANINESFLLKSSQREDDIDSLGSNVLFLNPSFEENYKELGYTKLCEDGTLFEHITMGTRLLPKNSSESSI